jgi:hypothetical protein
MSSGNIQLKHYGDAVNTSWYWTDENNRVISPYMGDSAVAERWGQLYREAVKDGAVVINGRVYHANK